MEALVAHTVHQAQRRRRQELLRKRKVSLIKKANELHTMGDVGVALLVRLDREILFYSSDIDVNYPSIVAVRLLDSP